MSRKVRRTLLDSKVAVKPNEPVGNHQVPDGTRFPYVPISTSHG